MPGVGWCPAPLGQPRPGEKQPRVPDRVEHPRPEQGRRDDEDGQGPGAGPADEGSQRDDHDEDEQRRSERAEQRRDEGGGEGRRRRAVGTGQPDEAGGHRREKNERDRRAEPALGHRRGRHPRRRPRHGAGATQPRLGRDDAKSKVRGDRGHRGGEDEDEGGHGAPGRGHRGEREVLEHPGRHGEGGQRRAGGRGAPETPAVPRIEIAVPERTGRDPAADDLAAREPAADPPQQARAEGAAGDGDPRENEQDGEHHRLAEDVPEGGARGDLDVGALGLAPGDDDRVVEAIEDLAADRGTRHEE